MKNKYVISGELVIIYLDKKDGSTIETLISLSELERLMSYDVKWYAHFDPKMNQYYATGYLAGTGRKGTKLKLHRIITDAQDGYLVDHINHDTLNNTNDNLRIVSSSGNQRNRRKSKNNTSGVPNVRLRGKRWQVIFNVDRKQKSFGNFDTIEEAAIVAERIREELLIKEV
jgi:hypothetical protein